MKFFCPAKINLYLKLLGKRPDGYHELESLFAFLDLDDELEVKKSDSFQLEILGEFASFVDPTHNLFTKILDFFSQEFGVSKNLHIKIVKNIPVGAGLGGGSSNAAYFMKALNEIFSLNLSKEKLRKISLNFGSDIAFFFEEKAAIARGRGEEITGFKEFPPILTLLVNPRIHLSTKEVFEKFHQTSSLTEQGEVEDLLRLASESQRTRSSSPAGSRMTVEDGDFFELIKNLPNDLTKPAISIAPVISEILTELKNYGADFAKMSGSGSTCFGIFFDEKSLKIAEEKFEKNYPGFFVKKVRILSSV